MPVIAHNDLSQKEPEQKWHLRKNFVLVLRDNGEFGIKLSNRFLGSPKHLYQMLMRSEVQTIFFDKALWKNIISGKACAFQHCETWVWLFLFILYELA